MLPATAALAEPIVGRASVTDGDTVVIRDTRIRLHGIDAPESAQMCRALGGKEYRCGQAAALAVNRLRSMTPAKTLLTYSLICENRDRGGVTIGADRDPTQKRNLDYISTY